MTTWTTISDATLTTGKPWTQSVARALRDNLVAFCEAATGAPKVSPKAISASVTKARTDALDGSSVLALGSIPTGFQPLTFDEVDIDTFSWLDSPYNKFQPDVAGTFRVSVAVTILDTNTSAIMTFRKNGSPFGEPVDCGTAQGRQVITEFVELNGTTDYVEVICTSAAGYTCLGYAYFMAELAGAA